MFSKMSDTFFNALMLKCDNVFPIIAFQRNVL